MIIQDPKEEFVKWRGGNCRGDGAGRGHNATHRIETWARDSAEVTRYVSTKIEPRRLKPED
jgi:hypothetical protein